MEQSRHQKILLSPPQPPAYLVAKILRAIDREERQRIFRRMAWSAGFLTLSLGAAGASVADLNNELSRSGFLSFLSLFGSDFSFAAGHFGEMAFSLGESFPALAAALSLASIGLVLWFGVILIREASIARRQNGVRQSFS